MQFIPIIKSIFLNQFRQDFLGIQEKIKQQLGISLPYGLSWTLALFFQSMFAVLLCAFILETIPIGQMWWIIVSLVLLFNLYLPATMARQNALRVSEHPLQYSLWQSAHPQHKLLFAWLVADLAIFWLHEMLYQLVVFYVLIRIAPNWAMALVMIVLWVVVVSNIYISVLYQEVCKRWSAISAVSGKHEIFYLLQCIGIGLSLCFVAHQLFFPLMLHPLSSELIRVDTLPLALKELSVQLKAIVEQKLLIVSHYYTSYQWAFFASGILVILSLTLRLLKFWISPIQIHLNRKGLKLKESKSRIYCFYRWIAEKLYPGNPWIIRDITLLERVQPHLRLPLKLHVSLPPSICSLSAFFFLSVNGMTPKGIVIGFWLVTCVALFQTTWFWLWSYPMLHPESELRNVDLTHLSPIFTLGQLMQSKIKLLSVLLLPFQIISSFLFLISILLVGGWLELIIGLIGLWSLFIIVCVISIWWTTYCTQFQSEGLLLIRLDRYESKLLQQLYHYPRRLLVTCLMLLFLICFFFDHQLDEYLMYGALLALLVLTFLSYYLYRRIEGRHSYSKEVIHE